MYSDRTKSNGLKLKEGIFGLDIRRKLLYSGDSETGSPEKLWMPITGSVKLDGTFSIPV